MIIGLKSTILKACLLLVVIIAVGCDSDSGEPVMPPKGVIEAYISSDGFPEVYFTSSITPGIDGSLTENLIRWGKVTISDGEETYVMTGGPDNGNLPLYHYYTRKMRGVPGKSYTITADFQDFHVSARGRIPSPTPIDSLVFYPTDTDTLRSAVIYFTAPEDAPAYYYVSMVNIGRGSRPYPCMMCTIRADRPGGSYSLPVMRPKRKINDSDYEPLFTVGEEFIIILNRVEQEVFDFWSSYENMVLFTNSPFLDVSGSLPTNIEGGLGVFSAQGCSSMVVKCK